MHVALTDPLSQMSQTSGCQCLLTNPETSIFCFNSWTYLFLSQSTYFFSFLFVYSVYHTSKGEVEWLPQSILSTMLLLSDPNFCQSIDLPSFNALMYKLNINRIGTYSIVPIYLSKTKLYSKYKQKKILPVIFSIFLNYFSGKAIGEMTYMVYYVFITRTYTENPKRLYFYCSSDSK